VILGLLSVALVTSGCLDAQSGGEAPASGGMLKYSVPVEVTNEGEMPAADFALALYIDGEKSAITTIDRLQGGVSVTKTFSIAVTAGPHSLKAVVDEANKIKEPRRANNVDEITFTF
jgi:subtilase family serine protease